MDSRISLKTKLILVLFTLLLAVPATGEFFKYVDDNGNMHFTDDPGSVPEKYKSQVNGQIDAQIKKETEHPSYGRFVDNQDGTVTDTKTRLIWLKDLDTVGVTIQNHCEVLDAELKDGKLTFMTQRTQVTSLNNIFILEGNGKKRRVHNPWRLPTLEELRELVYIDGERPADGEGKELPPDHPFENIPEWGDFWTGTKAPLEHRQERRSNAKDLVIIDLRTGDTDYGGRGASRHIWPVRNGY